MACTCPPGRPLGMDHLPHCDDSGQPDIRPRSSDAQVQVMRDEVGRPIAIPGELVEQHDLIFHAYQLKVRGKSWDAIASELMYPSALHPDGSAIAAAVRRYLDDGQRVFGRLKAQEFKAMVLARLEMATDAVWDEAMRGKPASVMALLATQDRIVKLVGLDTATDEDATQLARTVVVPADESGYVRELQQVAGAPTVVDQAPEATTS